MRKPCRLVHIVGKMRYLFAMLLLLSNFKSLYPHHIIEWLKSSLSRSICQEIVPHHRHLLQMCFSGADTEPSQFFFHFFFKLLSARPRLLQSRELQERIKSYNDRWRLTLHLKAWRSHSQEKQLLGKEFHRREVRRRKLDE